MINQFLAGFFVFNSIPHLVKGITGQTHMTPFKKVSSPILNIIWSFINLAIGLYISNGLPTKGEEMWWFLIGGFALSLTAAWLFGRPNASLPWLKD